MKPALDLQAELDRLEGLTLFELRNEWRRLYRMAPPMRLSRDLTLRGIAYKLQEQAQGGLSRSLLARLAQSAEPAGVAGLAVARERGAFVMPKPGTRLIREWRGVTHAVLVHADGYEWQDQKHRSLSLIARAITGAHWSGPRFFGLRQSRVQKAERDEPERRAKRAGVVPMNAIDRATRTPTLHCAIYTRKSSEEGLEQEFNSLDAQREACEAYVRSQKHAGWQALAEMYDDGGLSGGTMERPALRRLLADVRAGKVQIVVVYKIDRLTRSLFDFAKIVETLDARGASFVSVTQQFNTTTSMGRLTLNVLLSFAQFEREITGERIRDKIAASKAKGMWMGGNVPLGYVVRERKLEVDPEAAEKVRTIFRRYVELGTVALLKAELDRAGMLIGGRSLGRGALYHMLSNRIYRGEITHKGRAFAGLHAAIIEPELWDVVQARLEANRVERSVGAGAEHPSLLTGLIGDGEGRRMVPTHSVKNGKRGLRYRYYASIEGSSDAAIASTSAGRPLRIPAGDVEALVSDRLRSFLASRPELGDAIAPLGLDADVQQALLVRAQQKAASLPTMAAPELKAMLQQMVGQVVVEPDRLQLSISRRGVLIALGLQAEEKVSPQEPNGPAVNGVNAEPYTSTIDVRLARRGKGVRLVIEGASTAEADPGLVKLLQESFALRDQLLSGSDDSIETMSKRLGLSKGRITSRIRLAWLAPDIVKSILDGSQLIGFGVTRLLAMSKDLPHDWTLQRQMLGFQ